MKTGRLKVQYNTIQYNTIYKKTYKAPYVTKKLFVGAWKRYCWWWRNGGVSTNEDRIKSSEVKECRQILRVTWMDERRANDWVLKKARTEPFCYSQSRKESFRIMVMCYGKNESAWRKK